LHEKSSVIITTNKSPKQWAEALEDEVLSTALLDRILYRCEVVKLSGESYRMENRQTIFNKISMKQKAIRFFSLFNSLWSVTEQRIEQGEKPP
jgi:hypothetical protein